MPVKTVLMNKLHLHNYQGFTTTITANGRSIAIYGANATGKTMIRHALSYLLTHKNGFGKKDYEIKNLDSQGNPIHGLEHTVEVELLVDGVLFILKKVYTENWKKVMGSTEREFSGHTTTYFVNGVSTTFADYQETLKSIASEQLFQLLLNPLAFNELHWTERRRILQECAGEVSDSEVITLNPALAVVPEILQGRTLEEMQPILRSRYKQTNKEVEKVQIKESEAQRKIPQELLEDAGEEVLKQELATLTLEEETLRKTVKQLTENEAHTALRQERTTLQEQVDRVVRQKKDQLHQATRKQEQRDKLRSEWETQHRIVFSLDDPQVCLLCGQHIPEEIRQAAREKARSQFETDQQAKLAAISQQGKDLAREIALLEQEIKALEQEEVTLTGQLTKVQLQVKEMADHNSRQEADLRSRLAVNSGLQAECRRKLTHTHAGEQARARVRELQEEHRTLKEELLKIESQIMALNEFTRVKMTLLQDRINHLFSMATFKLFEEQVNGDIVECCEALYNGVPFNSNLNDGHKIPVGMDIINTLSRHYGVVIPLVVDNRESIDELAPTNAQVISLYVNKHDRVLRTEYDPTIQPLSPLPLFPEEKTRRPEETRLPERLPAAVGYTGPGF